MSNQNHATLKQKFKVFPFHLGNRTEKKNDRLTLFFLRVPTQSYTFRVHRFSVQRTV